MRTKHYLLMLALVILTLPASSQMVEILNRNNIKINASSLAFKNISLQYERSITKRLSAGLGFRVGPKGTVPLQTVLSNVFDENDFDLTKLEIGNTAITPELRIYLGRGRNRGFYLAPYGRYAHFTMTLPINYNYNGQPKQAFFDGHVNSISGGLMVGMQYTIARIVVLDIWLIGGHYGSSKGDAVFTPSSPLSPQEQQALQNELNGINVKPFTFTSTVNANGGTLQTTGPWAGFRGGGINVGIRF
ncbi:MAG TPA: DUF3575 domain-containing protein [Chitinophagaceae bacterium]|nr:DUF3575 domain-containing protein [Chitinophagaceae bacterium]